MGRQSRQCPNGGQRLLVCRLGRAGARTESLIGGRSECDIGSLSLVPGCVEASGEYEVVLVIE